MRNFTDREAYQRTRRATAEKRRVRLEGEVLAWLRAQEIDRHSMAIARAVGIPAATAQRILRDLERRGAVSSTRIGLGGRTFFRVVERKPFPVTDPELDAPDGAVVDDFERVGETWQPLDTKKRRPPREGETPQMGSSRPASGDSRRRPRGRM